MTALCRLQRTFAKLGGDDRTEHGCSNRDMRHQDIGAVPGYDRTSYNREPGSLSQDLPCPETLRPSDPPEEEGG